MAIESKLQTIFGKCGGLIPVINNLCEAQSLYG